MISTNPTTARTKALQDTLTASEALLLCQPEDIRYYSGFDCLVSSEREAFLVITATKAHLLYASFSPTLTVFDGIILRKGVFLSQVAQHIQEIQAQEPFETLYCDFDHLLHAEYLHLSETASCTLAALDRSSIIKQRS
ncbi:aminopeptidase P family N-terminal domain-containing protein, partial [Candidatus Woesebacteria bacterium]|nr:aminopeptidase P family N-terminal domain-containing protein [Candidatus Woesebacteria bacterium]